MAWINIMRISVLAIVASTLTLGACSSDEYTPSPGADPKSMFQTACMSCHVATESGKVIALSSENNTPEAVAIKISNGSMSMPKFPNIKGAELEALSEWVVENSEPKL
mgnify:CR=1 FL=1